MCLVKRSVWCSEKVEAAGRSRDMWTQSRCCQEDSTFPMLRVSAVFPGATRLLLDNMEPPVLREAVALVAGRVPTEASGGINLDTIGAKAATGVDYVSVGRLTQSAPAADIGLDFTPL